MSLRLQLLAVGLLTLVLPWTGYRYVQEMETALRGGLEPDQEPEETDTKKLGERMFSR